MEEEQKQKLPMYYQQIYDLMEQLNKAYVRRYGQHYLRFFKQFYSRVRFELTKEQKKYFEDRFKELEKQETVEKNEFNGLSVDFQSQKIAERSEALLNPVYELQLKLYEYLEDSTIFNFLKQNMELI